MRITIYLYRRDPDADPSKRDDIGIPPIVLPVFDIDGAQELAETALLIRLGKGRTSPTAGHVEDERGREIMSLLLIGTNKIQVDRHSG